MDRDDGASLLVAFRGLQAESMKQGEAHLSIANELENLVADPFESWADRHAARIADSKALLLDGFLGTYEEAVSDVSGNIAIVPVDVSHLQDTTQMASGDQAEGDLLQQSAQGRRSRG